MLIRMDNVGSLAPERITDFLTGSAGIEFTGQSRTEKYAWIERVLVEQQYSALTKKQRGAVRALLTKGTDPAAN